MISSSQQKGFTIIELIVSVAIFAFMTAFLVAKYGNFNQSILLTNQAYDVALTLRNAQMYGLNVKSKPTDTAAYSPDISGYTYGYGIHFSTASAGTPAPNTQMIFFSDANDNKTFDTGETIASYTLKAGTIISDICSSGSETDCAPNARTALDVVFKRPDPHSYIYSGGSSYAYAEISVKATGGSKKRIAVRTTGQVSVLHGN
jgi:prepilin-type N-terminal cleavage/methylation domain-containing protein